VVKHEEEAREVLEFHLGLLSQAYSKKIQGFALPFGTQPHKKGEYEAPPVPSGTSTRFQTIASGSKTADVKEQVQKLK
jgi:hypothetical protein